MNPSTFTKLVINKSANIRLSMRAIIHKASKTAILLNNFSCDKISILMGRFFKTFLQAIAFIFKSLRPVFLILFIIVVIFASLLAYDRYNTIKERKLGASLIDNLNVEADCATKLIKPGDKFDFKFTFNNKNSQSVFLEEVGVDLNILGTEERKFTKLLKTQPPSKKEEEEGRLDIYKLDSDLVIAPKSNKTFILKMQTASRKQAKAKPDTLVIYEGKLYFFISPEITSAAVCKVQVRYAK